MPHPNVLMHDTKLYCPAEPDGRVFPAGEQWPGDAWSDKPGGEPVGGNAAAGALKDLIEANDRLDQMSDNMARKDHDLAVMASERDAAKGQVADLEQRAIAAEKAQAEAETAARDYMLERDQARSAVKTATDALDAAKAEHEAKVADLMEQLNGANQALADAKDKAAVKKAAKASTSEPEAGADASTASAETVPA